jgi:hypothetical protein
MSRHRNDRHHRPQREPEPPGGVLPETGPKVRVVGWVRDPAGRRYIAADVPVAVLEAHGGTWSEPDMSSIIEAKTMRVLHTAVETE